MGYDATILKISYLYFVFAHLFYYITPDYIDSEDDIVNDYSESLLVHFRRVESLKKDAVDYVSIDLNRRQLCDLELLLNRAYYPLMGYLTKSDYDSVLDQMRLSDGTLWPISCTLPFHLAAIASFETGRPPVFQNARPC